MAGSIRKRGEHSWELHVFAGRDPDTGRKQYVSRTVRGGKREAEKELARLVAQVDDGLITASPGTMGELVERWYAKGELEWSPTTADGYRSLLDRCIIPRWGDVPLQRLKAADLDAWYAELRRTGGAGGNPLAANSVKRIHAVLRTALAQAVKWGWLATARIAEEVGALNGLVNNAGITVGGPVGLLNEEDWRHQFEVNFFGLVNLTKAALPLVSTVDGRLVHIGSISGRITGGETGPYSASKHAVEAFNWALRGELARNTKMS